MKRIRATPIHSAICLTMLLSGLVGCAKGDRGQAPQNPSPMEEHIRAHERLAEPDGKVADFEIADVLEAPVPVYLPETWPGETSGCLVIHFHGAPYVPVLAARMTGDGCVVAAVHLGSGSSVYERAFSNDEFGRLVDRISHRLVESNAKASLDAVTITSFSAGYGAVRAILSQSASSIRPHAIVLLDGLHTDYLPAGRPLADGGHLNTAKLSPFLEYARMAVAGERTLMITHSEVFPGTYASTTETADYLIRELGLSRTPVVEWGPVGMQQVGVTRAGNLAILAFAGNSAPDHVDHFHGLPEFLKQVNRLVVQARSRGIRPIEHPPEQPLNRRQTPPARTTLDGSPQTDLRRVEAPLPAFGRRDDRNTLSV